MSGTVPASAAEQTLSVNTDSVDLEGEHLVGPLAGHHVGYCGVSGSKLNGYCVSCSYYACAVKLFTVPAGR